MRCQKKNFFKNKKGLTQYYKKKKQRKRKKRKNLYLWALVESYDHLATTLVRSDSQATSPSRAICLQKIVQQNGFDGFVFDGEVLRWKKIRVVSSEWECECECESEKKTNKMKSKSVRGVFKIEIFFL